MGAPLAGSCPHGHAHDLACRRSRGDCRSRLIGRHNASTIELVHNPATNDELVRRYTEAVMRFDYDTRDALRHPDWTAFWPQSGEVVRGSTNDRQIAEHYPGGHPRIVQGRIVGSEDRWAVSPLGGVYRVAGEGENWWAEWQQIYPDGRVYFTVTLIELREGKVLRETIYWAEPFDPPAWRAPWVESATDTAVTEPAAERSS